MGKNTRVTDLSTSSQGSTDGPDSSSFFASRPGKVQTRKHSRNNGTRTVKLVSRESFLESARQLTDYRTFCRLLGMTGNVRSLYRFSAKICRMSGDLNACSPLFQLFGSVL